MLNNDKEIQDMDASRSSPSSEGTDSLTTREGEGGGADEALLRQAWGALNFILAFYQPGQRYLDTEAWKNAEAGGKHAHDALSERLGNPPGWWSPNDPLRAASEPNPTRPAS